MSHVPELQALLVEKDRVRREYRDKERALRAEARAREDQLHKELDDRLVEIDNKLLLSLSNAGPSTLRTSSSNQLDTYGQTVEAVTSSSPVDTTEIQRTEPVQSEPEFGQAALSEADSGLQKEAPAHHPTHHSLPAPSPNVLEASAPDSTDQLMAAPTSPVSTQQLPETAGNAPASAHPQPETAEETAVLEPARDHLPESTASPEKYINIDLSHVVPEAAQKLSGTTTYMVCRRGRQAASKYCRFRHCMCNLSLCMHYCPPLPA